MVPRAGLEPACACARWILSSIGNRPPYAAPRVFVGFAVRATRISRPSPRPRLSDGCQNAPTSRAHRGRRTPLPARVDRVVRVEPVPVRERRAISPRCSSCLELPTIGGPIRYHPVDRRESGRAAESRSHSRSVLCSVGSVVTNSSRRRIASAFRSRSTIL